MEVQIRELTREDEPTYLYLERPAQSLNGHAPNQLMSIFEVPEAPSLNGHRPDARITFAEFDFESEDDLPRYVVDGLLERGTVNIISSDTGVGKTWVGNALTVAAICGEPWLGREVNARRVLVVDEENPLRVIKARLRALGMTSEAGERLRYANRQGIAIGADGCNAWLLEQAGEHRADLILIDTAIAATNVEDVNDNSGVGRLYSGLRAIAKETDAAIVLFHHERKRAAGQPYEAGQAMMGARQWAGQADSHITLTARGTDVEELENGNRRLTTEAVMRVPKLRDDVPPQPELIVIASEKDEAGYLLWATVESHGPIDRASKDDAMLDRIVDVVSERGELRRGELAAAMGVDSTDGTFGRALKKGLREDVGLLRQPKYGVYGLGEVAEVPL